MQQVDDAREEGVLVGVDAAVVLLQLQMVATTCSVGVNDIRWTSWDGYKLVMDAIYHGDFTVGTTLKEGLPLKLVKKQGDAVSAAVIAVTYLSALFEPSRVG